MSFYETGNPVPSVDPRDLDDNAKHIDEIVNSTLPTFTDRLGTERRTLAGIEADADAIVLRDELANSANPAKGAAIVGLDGRTVADFIRDTIIVVAGAADSAATLNAALVQGAADGRVVYTPGRGVTLNLLSTVTVPSGATYICDAKVQAGAQTDIFSLSGKTNASIELRKDLIGNNANVLQNGVIGVGANFCSIVVHGEIKGIKNKGVSLVGQTSGGTTAKHNLVRIRKVTGCNSSTGAGLSLFGDKCTDNTVYVDDASLNRLGVTFNGASDNQAHFGSISDNTDAGFMIDGVVTSSGDGGKGNRIFGGVYDRNGPSALYAGIYLGNGSSNNTFFGPVARNNTGAGLRQSGGLGYENVGNTFYDLISSGNGVNGVTLSYSPDTTMYNPKISGNTGRGITHANSDNFKAFGGFSRTNTTAGYLAQSAKSQLQGTEVSGNATGVQTAAGGSAVYSGHLFLGCTVTGNTTDYNIATATAKIVSGMGVGNLPEFVGDANATGAAGKTFIVNAPITATRTISTPPTVAPTTAAGDRIRVVRLAAATGASSVFLGGLKGLAVGQWCEAEFDGTAWVLIGFGSL